jgi:hypothetical protein
MICRKEALGAATISATYWQKTEIIESHKPNPHFRQASSARKRLLKSATNLVGDVEFRFLAPNTVREERSAAEWRRWRSTADQVLMRVARQRPYGSANGR